MPKDNTLARDLEAIDRFYKNNPQPIMPKDYQEVERIVEEFADKFTGLAWHTNPRDTESKQWLRTALTTHATTQVEKCHQMYQDYADTHELEDVRVAVEELRKKMV
jgi:hypothetical protein